MSRFDLLAEFTFTATDTILITHNLNRYIFNVRLIIAGDPRLSQRELVRDIQLDVLDPLNKCTVLLTGSYTGTVQIIAEDTVQSPYYTVFDKLLSQRGVQRSSIALVSNGTLSNNEWWTYSELVPDRRILFPFTSRITEFTWDANGSSLDFDLIFYKNGIASENIIYTHEVRNNDSGGEIVSNVNLDLAAGDWIRVLYIDQGSNASDGVLVLWITRIEDV